MLTSYSRRFLRRCSDQCWDKFRCSENYFLFDLILTLLSSITHCHTEWKYGFWHSYVQGSRIYFQITTNKMQLFLIYLFLQILYMFQAIPPPIIRSTKLYIQPQVLSTNTVACCSSIDWQTWSCMYSFVLLMMGGGTAWNM